MLGLRFGQTDTFERTELVQSHIDGGWLTVVEDDPDHVVHDPGRPGQPDLEVMTGPELKTYAESEGIDLGGATKVQPMREAIRSALQRRVEPADA